MTCLEQLRALTRIRADPPTVPKMNKWATKWSSNETCQTVNTMAPNRPNTIAVNHGLKYDEDSARFANSQPDTMIIGHRELVASEIVAQINAVTIWNAKPPVGIRLVVTVAGNGSSLIVKGRHEHALTETLSVFEPEDEETCRLPVDDPEAARSEQVASKRKGIGSPVRQYKCVQGPRGKDASEGTPCPPLGCRAIDSSHTLLRQRNIGDRQPSRLCGSRKVGQAVEAHGTDWNTNGVRPPPWGPPTN